MHFKLRIDNENNGEWNLLLKEMICRNLLRITLEAKQYKELGVVVLPLGLSFHECEFYTNLGHFKGQIPQYQANIFLV